MALIPALLDRIKRLIPPGWFASDAKAPVRHAVLGGLSDGLTWVTSRQTYLRAQTRIRTATGFNLDLIAWDFFGPRFRRRVGETDDSFRPRVLKELFRPRNTREAIVQALVDLTGTAPEIVELWNPGDCGAYDTPTLAYAGDDSGNSDLSGFDAAPAAFDPGDGTFAFVTPSPAVAGAPGVGCWGSYDYPNQLLITAHRGVVTVELDGCGGFDTAALAYAGGATVGAGFYGPDDTTAAATDAEIYETIAQTVAGGNVAWTAIAN